jgi:hypothetical protein
MTDSNLFSITVYHLKIHSCLQHLMELMKNNTYPKSYLSTKILKVNGIFSISVTHRHNSQLSGIMLKVTVLKVGELVLLQNTNHYVISKYCSQVSSSSIEGLMVKLLTQFLE